MDNKQYYAKNVSKIDELLVYDDLNIIRNNDNNYILGKIDMFALGNTVQKFIR